MKTAAVLLTLLCAWPDTGQVAPPARPVIWCYGTSKGCYPCRKLWSAAQHQDAFDFRLHETNYMATRRIPRTWPKLVHDALANPKEGDGFPFLIWRDKRGAWHMQSGFTDLKTLKEEYAATQK